MTDGKWKTTDGAHTSEKSLDKTPSLSLSVLPSPRVSGTHAICLWAISFALGSGSAFALGSG